MKAGNTNYEFASDLPAHARVFPLSGALLLPGGQLPLNIFEPRFLEMFEDAVKGDRLIAMIQPLDDGEQDKGQSEDDKSDLSTLYEVGCIGRITAFQEAGDGRYLVNLSGICRYKTKSPVSSGKNYPVYEVEYFESDLSDSASHDKIDRKRLLDTFKNYLEANQMDADWESVEETDTNQLVNALCTMSPYGPAEKQAMLEAENLLLRAETLIAITEFELTKTSGDPGGNLQ